MTFPLHTEVSESGYYFRPRGLNTVLSLISKSAPLASIETVWRDDKLSVGNDPSYRQILSIRN